MAQNVCTPRARLGILHKTGQCEYSTTENVWHSPTQWLWVYISDMNIMDLILRGCKNLLEIIISKMSWLILHCKWHNGESKLHVGHTLDKIYLMYVASSDDIDIGNMVHPHLKWWIISTTWAHFYKHDLTLIPVWISNHMPSKGWDGITYPFLNFNGYTVEV